MSPAPRALLDAYCERGSAGGLWAEPLNAASNLAFLGAAAWALWSLRRGPARPPAWRACWDLGLAIALMAAVAIGSGLWHTVARPWARLADQAPIALLMILLLETTLRRRLFWPGRARAWALAIFLAANGVLALLVPRDTLKGSIFYAPACLALVGLALAGGGASFLVTWALFTASLVLRTVDLPLCAAFPAGTHFLWHLLNAAVLLRLTLPLVRQARGMLP